MRKDATEPPAGAAGDQQAASAQTTDETGELRYTVAVEGLDAVGNAEDLLTAFRKQSALEADRKDPANAAQIGRRSRADADLLAELLRSQGYYDAVGRAADRARPATRCAWSSTADPGQQYRFASVELPGPRRRRAEDAAKLRDAFAVKAGDPVIAAGRDRRRRRADRRRSARRASPSAKIGEQDIEINHQTHLATLILPVDPGPVARFGAIRVSGKPPFSARHVATIARFKPGDPFKRSKIDDLRRALIATEPGRRSPTSRSCRSTAAARSTSPSGSSRRRRTRSPASSATAPGRARGSRRAGPTATSSIPKAR